MHFEKLIPAAWWGNPGCHSPRRLITLNLFKRFVNDIDAGDDNTTRWCGSHTRLHQYHFVHEDGIKTVPVEWRRAIGKDAKTRFLKLTIRRFCVKCGHPPYQLRANARRNVFGYREGRLIFKMGALNSRSLDCIARCCVAELFVSLLFTTSDQAAP